MAKRQDVRQIAFDPKRNCGTCRFFDGWRTYQSHHADPDVARGYCKRYPPSPLVIDPKAEIDADPAIPSGKTLSNVRLAYIWPVVDEVTWCGDFSQAR